MKIFRERIAKIFPVSWRDLLVSVAVFAIATVVCLALQTVSSGHEGFASPVFVLAVLLVSNLTRGYLFGILASVAGVICVNFIFTYPYWEVNFTIAGYPVTFMVFLAVSVFTCTLTNQVRQQQELRSEADKEKLRADLLRSLSHDIRTPLTSIVGSTSAILENEGLSAEERQELLENTRDEAQWLIRVVENLLSITRIGEEQAKIKKSLEAAEEILSEAAGKFRSRFSKVRVSVKAPEELLMVPMDPILIVQVLSNLMENAVFHGKRTTHVCVSVFRDGNEALFSVRDDGCGIPEDVLVTLFDGKTGRASVPAGDGKRNMGIGLSVCNAIVRAHGGTISAHNLPDGAEFLFRLPLNQ